MHCPAAMKVHSCKAALLEVVRFKDLAGKFVRIDENTWIELSGMRTSVVKLPNAHEKTYQAHLKEMNVFRSDGAEFQGNQHTRKQT